MASICVNSAKECTGCGYCLESKHDKLYCDYCGNEICDSDFYYVINEETLCEDCTNEQYQRIK